MSGTTPSLQYSFKDQRVLITGGGGGIAQALVERLYKDGAKIFILEINPSLVEQLKKDFPDARVEVADITKWNSTQQIIESFGPMDYLINNAVSLVIQPFMEIKEDTIAPQLDVTLKGMICVTQAVAKGMISSGNCGSIVNVASLAGLVATPGAAIYCMAKAGVIMLSKCLAKELGPHGIRVNSFSPTGVNTELFRQCADLWPDDFYTHRQPLKGKKAIELDEAVNSILFLLSPLSSMANGANLIVDGGISVC